MLTRELPKLKEARRTPKMTCLKVDRLTEQLMLNFQFVDCSKILLNGTMNYLVGFKWS